jgi:hypothetical protein
VGGQDGSPEGYLEQLMVAQAETDLAQDLATDCSVVASLCAASCHFAPTTKDSVSKAYSTSLKWLLTRAA